MGIGRYNLRLGSRGGSVIGDCDAWSRDRGLLVLRCGPRWKVGTISSGGISLTDCRRGCFDASCDLRESG